MKILAFSDTHLNEKAVKEIIKKAGDADILICAGDISWFGTGLKKILKTLDDEIQKPIYIISGNHEEGEPLEKICSSFTHVQCMDKKIKKIEDLTFFFWGGGGFAREDPKLEKATELFQKIVRKEDNVVFITHGPAYHTQLDYLEWAGHVGCKSRRKFITTIKPILHISGHLHEHMHEHALLGKTVLVNPGADGTIIELQPPTETKKEQ